MFKWVKLALFCLLANAAQAAEPSQTLSKLLAPYQSFSANFIQRTSANNSQVSQGIFLFARTNKFVWQTDKPYAEKIVSDGQYLWLYEADLEQVTRKPAAIQASIPSLILNAELESLQELFSLQQTIATENQQAFRLSARSEQTVFQQIDILFEQGLLAQLRLADSLGQVTLIDFHKARLNPVIKADVFVFNRPEGVDLIIDEASYD